MKRLILLAVFLLAVGPNLAPSVARADGEEGCDPAEPVACLVLPDVPPVTPDQPPGTSPSAAPAGAPDLPGAGVAVPAPRRPCPAPLPPAVAPPGVAAPAPPFTCRPPSVAAAVNRANAIYVRALRTLDARELALAWGGEALSDLQGQIAALRAARRYATPQLLAITPLDITVRVQTARVRTAEHWIYQERELGSGALLVDQDEWVENLYDLSLRGDAWIVMRDVITLLDGPPAPPPERGLSVSISLPRYSYFAGETVEATLSNDGSVPVSATGGYRCGPFTLERAGPAGWEPVPGPPLACPAILLLLQPGQSISASLPAGPAPGDYRLASRILAEGQREGVTVYSETYNVR
jgi:hypothetical protein